MGFSKFIDVEHEKPDTGKASNLEILVLRLDEEHPRFTAEPGKAILLNDTWELWEDRLGNYTFHFKHYKRPYITVHSDREFKDGKICFDGFTKTPERVTLFEVFDLRLFINWLTNFGDLVLHASGFVYEGKGYCFLGESQRGKSTLLRDLLGTPGLTPLGEDQVVLRYLDGQFRVFGTPWHTDASICSPLDAPLEKMFFLDRTREKTLERMTPLEVATRVLQTAFVPYYRAERMPLILERVALLAESTRCLNLSYKLGQDGLETIVHA